MGYIKTNNISTHLLKEDIINNNIKETYINSNIYNTLLVNPNFKISTLIKTIENDIDSLNNSLIKFDLYLNNYLNDYLNIDDYLSLGSHNNINSSPTQSILYKTPYIDNIKLDSFNVTQKYLTIDYETQFDDEKESE